MNIVEIKLSEIIVGERQRKKFSEIEELADSLKRLGLLQPIIITQNGRLVAGERRLRAAQLLGWEKIPARYKEELSEREIRGIELEENIKRQNLTWQEEALAVVAFHEECQSDDDEWTQEDTARFLGISVRNTRVRLLVGSELRQPDNKIQLAEGLTQASNIISRNRQRIADEALSRFDETFSDEDFNIKLNEADEAIDTFEPEPEPKIRPAKKDIKQADFIEWAQNYSGRKFNFIHIDFPYGVNFDSSAQARTAAKNPYADTPEIYFKLVKVFLENRRRYLLNSSHIMWWYSWKFRNETRQLIAEMAPELRVLPVPLIWHKSDNRGILPDSERGPRYTYEEALFISSGDRRIIRAKAASYAAPTNRSTGLHVSQKPEPVLRHFFEMFIDNLSEVLDPTCGSGTALVAAESLGAGRVVGLDIDTENVEDARRLLDRQRRIRAAENAAKETTNSERGTTQGDEETSDSSAVESSTD